MPQKAKQGGRGEGNAHLADEAVLVDGAALLAVGEAGRLGPHLLDVLEDHVAVAVEGLDAGQQLAVVPDRDQHLRVAPHRRLQDRERARAELVLLQQRDLVLPVSWARDDDGVAWLAGLPFVARLLVGREAVGGRGEGRRGAVRCVDLAGSRVNARVRGRGRGRGRGRTLTHCVAW